MSKKSDEEDLRVIASKIAQQVGKDVEKKIGSPHYITSKSSTTDLVTEIDEWSEKTITEYIISLRPNDEVVCEEGTYVSGNNNVRWLIDPIDATHGYINGKDEFTINAALILNKKPVGGIINAPAKKRLFYSFGLSNSFEINNNEKIKLTCKKKSKQNEINAVSHSNNHKPEVIELYKKYNVTNFTKMKSSLKFCVIASGEYDFYAAEPRAQEWDIAAGHAILEHAGGIVTDFKENEISYGKKDFKNSSLILKRGMNL